MGTDRKALKAISKAVDRAMRSPRMIEIVANAVKSKPLNLGPDSTRKMMVDGLANVGVLFAK